MGKNILGKIQNRFGISPPKTLKEKFAEDLQKSGQNEMANFILTNTNPEMNQYIETALEGKRYLVFCKTCNRVFVDLPFKEFYKNHTAPEWDIWFCEAVLHWAKTEGQHSIYCFSDKRNYDISSSLSFDCRKQSWPQIHSDVKAVVVMRDNFVKAGKRKTWVEEKTE